MQFIFVFMLSLLLASPVQAKDNPAPKTNWFYTRLSSDLEARYKKLLLNDKKISQKTNTSPSQTAPYFSTFQSQYYDFGQSPSLRTYKKASSSLDSINRIQVDTLKKYLKSVSKISASQPKPSPSPAPR